MFPNSPNIRLTLINVKNSRDNVGNSEFEIISAKSVTGMMFSVNAKEYYSSAEKGHSTDLAVKIISFIYDKSKYVQIDQSIYKVERTFINGQYIELYLNETTLKPEDIDGYVR